jgi:hypothetical protein
MCCAVLCFLLTLSSLILVCGLNGVNLGRLVCGRGSNVSLLEYKCGCGYEAGEDAQKARGKMMAGRVVLERDVQKEGAATAPKLWSGPLSSGFIVPLSIGHSL